MKKKNSGEQEMKDLGVTADWEKMPEEVKNCHHSESIIKRSNTVTEHFCPVCKIKYLIDKERLKNGLY